ncbi:MAG: 3-phosphoshikimate 1-carboxyvinyltransferase [Bacteroidales bacterium]|nr:3-phosphoshikimate 1-carboxyvinyltransferase [Bacteroidales bacterium]
MICTTIQNKDLEGIFKLLEKSLPQIEMAEIRLDRCPLSEDDITELFSSSDTPLVATCRVFPEGNITWEEAEKRLTAAIEAGAAFVDLEIEAPKEMGKRLRRECSEYGTVMIRSAHFFDGTPTLEVLQATAGKCRRFGGEIVKIATMANDAKDAERVLSLYDSEIPGRLIAFAMGVHGRMSRLTCLAKGAPFSYAALTEEEAAAPGQWSYDKMNAAIFGGKKPLDSGASLDMPASKSFAQRAILAAALAEGESKLEGYSPCGDNEAAIEVARALGADVTVEGNSVIVKGFGAKVPERIDVGESGLLTRLIIPVVAALTDQEVSIEGRDTLLRRPLKGATEIMARFGTVLRPAGEVEPGKSPDIKVPLSVQGPLVPGKADISGKDGSQLISGLLMALPLLKKDSVIHVSDPKSIPYMFITMDVLRKFGITIGSEMEGDEEFLETQDWSLCTGITFKIKGGQKYQPASFGIEGDWSAAANFLVAGALYGKVRLEGLDTTSLQADLSIMDILMDAGASLSQLEDEFDENAHTGTITVQRAPLRAFDTDLNNCPDLFPIVSVLAAYCHGQSHIQGFKRLSSKESDRGTAILDMLEKMGVSAFAEDDVLTVEGQSLESRCLTGNMLKGGEFTSSHDHRMAMALTVAAYGAATPIRIDDTQCVAKSFPGFLNTWKSAL